MADKSQLLTKKVEEAQSHQDSNRIGDAIKLYEDVIRHPLKGEEENTEEAVKAKETATYKLAQIYQEKGLYNELIELQKQILPLFIDMPKSKQAKIVRTLFDMTTKIEGKQADLVGLCKYIIEWCEKESRSFLRMRIENKLAELYFQLERFNDALEILRKLLFELKKKEDKQLIVEA